MKAIFRIFPEHKLILARFTGTIGGKWDVPSILCINVPWTRTFGKPAHVLMETKVRMFAA